MTALPTWQPLARPARIVLDGRYCRLEPLALRHAEELFEASMSPGAEERFRYLFESPCDRSEFERWVAAIARVDDPLAFAVIDRATQRCEGRQALMRITPEHGVVEIGSILWGPRIARTRVATEALYLAARYVFDDLGYRRLEWKCNDRNEPSKRAALRFGFRYEGLFRQHMVLKGESRDTAWFAMTDGDWPALRDAFEAWLEPSNFGDDGRQRERLETLRSHLAAR